MNRNIMKQMRSETMEYYELGIYKEMLRNAFGGSEDIISLIMPAPEIPQLSLRDNFLGGEFDITKTDDTGSTHTEHVVLEGYCQDRPFQCAAYADHRNLLCVDCYISKADGRASREITLQIYVMIHNSSVRLTKAELAKLSPKGYTGNRCDAVVQAIGRLLGPGSAAVTSDNNTADTKSPAPESLGTHRLKLVPAAKDPVAPFTENKEYCGKLLTYVCTDFMPCTRNR